MYPPAGGRIQVHLFGGDWRPDVMWIAKDIRNGYINLINSLAVADAVKAKYLDFKMTLTGGYMPRFELGREIVEIDERGRFRNQTFLLHGATEEDLKKAKENYKTTSWMKLKNYGYGTYIYELTFTNKNEEIPMYVNEIWLYHQKSGDLNARKLYEGSDYKSITESHGIVAPKTTKEFQFEVDGYYGKYGWLYDYVIVDIPWFE